MNGENPDRTRASLLQKASSGDEVAWAKLDALYRPLLTKWAVQAGAQPADADDVASEVLIILVRFLRRFEYDPARSFRAYLRTMMRNELSRMYRKQPRTQDESVLRKFVVDEATESDLIELLIREEEELVVPGVLLAARQRCKKESTWLSWEWTELHQRAAQDVARELGINVANVYVNRQRVAELIEKVGEELREDF